MPDPTFHVTPTRPDRHATARAALVAYLRLLATCIDDEADMLEEHEARGDEALRRFRNELLEMALKDAPVDALIERAKS